jgi:Niemann-Pick C1 protein
MITASAFRTYHTPLNSQPDLINALKAARQFAESVSQELGMQVHARRAVMGVVLRCLFL